MSHEFLANLWYFILALVWAIYICQELFVCGVGMLSRNYDVTSDSFKKVNESVATFWDGIQVWLIVAIGGLFATFPTAYGLTLQAMYVPIFLLILILILRGTSIELIYKSDDISWQKALARIWANSSLLLITVESVYLVNLFTGLPIKNNLMTEGFYVIFTKAAILGAVLLVTCALSLGMCWIKLTLGDSFKVLSKQSILWISGVSVFAVSLLFLTLTNKYMIFETGLFVEYPILWSMPIAAMLMYVIQFILLLKEKYAFAFAALIVAVSLVIFTGFSAAFPYILGSTIDPEEGLLIIDAAASQHALTLITVVTVLFLPVAIAYQTWKYKTFWRRF